MTSTTSSSLFNISIVEKLSRDARIGRLWGERWQARHAHNQLTSLYTTYTWIAFLSNRTFRWQPESTLVAGVACGIELSSTIGNCAIHTLLEHTRVLTEATTWSWRPQVLHLLGWVLGLAPKPSQACCELLFPVDNAPKRKHRYCHLRRSWSAHLLDERRLSSLSRSAPITQDLTYCNPPRYDASSVHSPALIRLLPRQPTLSNLYQVASTTHRWRALHQQISTEIYCCFSSSKPIQQQTAIAASSFVSRTAPSCLTFNPLRPPNW